MINKNDLFNLFPEPNNRGMEDITDAEIEIEVQLSTHFKVGKFKKLIENHELFFEHFKRGISKAGGESMDPADSKKVAAFVVFNRAWHYIKDVDLDIREDVLDLTLFNPHDLIYVVHLVIQFFEGGEEYEKCAHLYNIQQFLKGWCK